MTTDEALKIVDAWEILKKEFLAQKDLGGALAEIERLKEVLKNCLTVFDMYEQNRMTGVVDHVRLKITEALAESKLF